MKSLEELFEVEVGKVRTVNEIRARVAELAPIVAAYSAAHDAACSLPWLEKKYEYGFRKFSPKRKAAFKKLDADFPEGCSYGIALEALGEVLSDMTSLDEQVPEDVPNEKKAEVEKLIESFTQKIVDDHIRNARYWSGMFGSDSYIRINVFSWIAGVEPNYAPLEGMTEEEEKQHEEQMSDIVAPIKDALAAIDAVKLMVN